MVGHKKLTFNISRECLEPRLASKRKRCGKVDGYWYFAFDIKKLQCNRHQGYHCEQYTRNHFSPRECRQKCQGDRLVVNNRDYHLLKASGVNLTLVAYPGLDYKIGASCLERRIMKVADSGCNAEIGYTYYAFSRRHKRCEQFWGDRCTTYSKNHFRDFRSCLMVCQDGKEISWTETT